MQGNMNFSENETNNQFATEALLKKHSHKVSL